MDRQGQQHAKGGAGGGVAGRRRSPDVRRTTPASATPEGLWLHLPAHDRAAVGRRGHPRTPGVATQATPFAAKPAR